VGAHGFARTAMESGPVAGGNTLKLDDGDDGLVQLGQTIRGGWITRAARVPGNAQNSRIRIWLPDRQVDTVRKFMSGHTLAYPQIIELAKSIGGLRPEKSGGVIETEIYMKAGAKHASDSVRARACRCRRILKRNCARGRGLGGAVDGGMRSRRCRLRATCGFTADLPKAGWLRN